MVIYGIALVPLADIIQEEEREVMAPFYANNALLGGPTKGNTRIMRVLMEHVTDFGYFPKPEKSNNVCDHLKEVKAAEACFKAVGLTLQYYKGHWYVGGFIGGKEDRTNWLQPKVQEWDKGVQILGRREAQYPQPVNAELVMSLQPEWMYIQ
eukprot:6837340-Ditylum_brightwellii.AAC.1